MKPRLLTFYCCFCCPACRRADLARSPFAPPPRLYPLQINSGERQFFALGLTLSRGAFAYAELAKQATAVANDAQQNRTGGTTGEIGADRPARPTGGAGRAGTGGGADAGDGGVPCRDCADCAGGGFSGEAAAD